MSSTLPANPNDRAHAPAHEHSVPWFWPFAAAIEMGTAGLEQFLANLKFLEEAKSIALPTVPAWATANRVVLDLDTMPSGAFIVIADYPTHLHEMLQIRRRGFT